MKDNLPWQVVRKDTGEVVASFAAQDHAKRYIWSDHDDPLSYEVRPAPEPPTCRTCKWWGGCHPDCETCEDGDVGECTCLGFPSMENLLTPADFGCSLHESKEAPDAPQK